MENNPIKQLMEDLARDLVRLEGIPDLDPEWVEQISQVYEEIYKQLIEIQRL